MVPPAGQALLSTLFPAPGGPRETQWGLDTRSAGVRPAYVKPVRGGVQPTVGVGSGAQPKKGPGQQ